MRAIIAFAVLLVAANCFSFSSIGHDISHLASSWSSEVDKYSGCVNTVNQNKDAFIQLQNLRNEPQDVADYWNPVAQGLYNILVSCTGNTDEWSFLLKIELNNSNEVTNCVNNILAVSEDAYDLGNIIDAVRNGQLSTLIDDSKNLASTCETAEKDNIGN